MIIQMKNTETNLKLKIKGCSKIGGLRRKQFDKDKNDLEGQ